MAIHYIEVDEHRPDKIILEKWDNRFTNVYDSIPTSKFDGKKDVWYFNKTWQVCLALKNTFKNTLEVGEKLREWTTGEFNNRIAPAHALRSQLEAPGYDFLFPHQRADVQFLATARRAILANDMGTGKSQSAVASMRYLHELGEEVFPALIACPNSTKMSWAREVEKVWPGLKVAVVDGSAAKRRKILEEPAHIYVINWESIRTHSKLAPYGPNSSKKCEACGGRDPKIKETACEVHKKELNNIDFKTVFGDEIHRIKDPSSKVSRSFKAATGNANFRFGLSGTPIASSPEDLFSPLNWLFPESYPSKTKYLDRYCDITEGMWGKVVLGIKENMKEEFFGGLDPFLRRMPKELVLSFLPEVLYQRRDVIMGTKQAKAYKQMKEQMIAELDGGDVIKTTSPLTKMTRLLQFASALGDVYYTDEVDEQSGRTYQKAHLTLSDPSAKLDAFMDDIKDYEGKSVVVFANSSQLINMLSARLEKAGITHGMITGEQSAEERQVHMDAFQEGRIPFILCTISAGGTGITLTKGSVGVFLQRSWSMIDNLQAEARVHRIGSEQHDSILIVDYVTIGTVEELVFEAVEKKTNQLETILRDDAIVNMYLTGDNIDQYLV